MFITLITIFCLGGVCKNPGNEVNKVTINTSEILEVSDFQYYWRNDGKIEDNGSFTPNKGAVKMNGCFVKMKGKNRLPYFTEFPCDNYVRPKLK